MYKFSKITTFGYDLLVILCMGISAEFFESIPSVVQSCIYKKSDKVYHSGYQTERLSVVNWNATLSTRKSLQATNTSTLHQLPPWNSIKLLVTGITTVKICSQRWIWVTGKNLFFVQ